MFTTTLYIQVFSNRVIARNVDTGNTAEHKSEQPFTHQRALVGNFSAAKLAVKHAVNYVKGRSILNLLRVVIQPMEVIEGGLTQVEDILFHELVKLSGVWKVKVWVGETLSDDEVRSKLSLRKRKIY